jgi:hypothetical protein
MIKRGNNEDCTGQIWSLYDYIAGFDCKTNADHVLDRLLEADENISFTIDFSSF